MVGGDGCGVVFVVVVDDLEEDVGVEFVDG